MAESLIEQLKTDYIKMTNKFRIDGILKPIQNPKLPLIENPSKKILSKT